MLPGGGFYPLQNRTRTPLVPRHELGGSHFKIHIIISFIAKMCSMWETWLTAQINFFIKNPRYHSLHIPPFLCVCFVGVGLFLTAVNVTPLAQHISVGDLMATAEPWVDLPTISKCKCPDVNSSSALLEFLQDLMALTVVCLCLLPQQLVWWHQNIVSASLSVQVRTAANGIRL